MPRGPGRGAREIDGRTHGSDRRVLIDGRNVQRALERGPRPSLPTAALVARLRAAFSPPTEVELILDGHAGRDPPGRIAPGLCVVFTKGATADQVIGDRVDRGVPDARAGSILVRHGRDRRSRGPRPRPPERCPRRGHARGSATGSVAVPRPASGCRARLAPGRHAARVERLGFLRCST